jgi:uncharacterized protein (TIGR01777 family)
MAGQQTRRIIITGITGLIGSHIARQLARRGDQVIGFSRNIERSRRAVPEAAEHIQWSTSMASGAWTEVIDGAYAVINLAGAPIAQRWTEKRKMDMYDSRIIGTRHLVDAMRQARQAPRVLINASAVGYYGGLRNDRITETSSKGDDFLAKLCVDWEQEAYKASEIGVRVATIRTGIVLDPREGALAKLLPPFRFFVGGPIGSGAQPFPWIHINDEAGLFLWALDNEAVQGPVNGAAPGIMNNRDFSKTLGKVLHRPSFMNVPKFALDLLFGEGSVVVTGGQNIVPERALSLGYKFAFPELEPALQDLL